MLSISNPEYLRPEVFRILLVSWILEYLYIHNEVSLGWDPSLNMKFIYFSCTSCAHNMKVILYNILKNVAQKTKFMNDEKEKVSLSHTAMWTVCDSYGVTITPDSDKTNE